MIRKTESFYFITKKILKIKFLLLFLLISFVSLINVFFAHYSITTSAKIYEKESILKNNTYYNGYIVKLENKNSEKKTQSGKKEFRYTLIKDLNEIKKIEDSYQVKNISKNYIRRIMLDPQPNDHLYKGNNGVIQNKPNQWNLTQLGFTEILNSNSESAWNIEKGSEEVIIAVIDTGIDLTNPDIVNYVNGAWGENNLWVNQGELSHLLTNNNLNTNNDDYISSKEIIEYFQNENLDIDGNGIINYRDIITTGAPNIIMNNQDEDQNGYKDDIFGFNFALNNSNIQDDLGHGTHVSGIIGAVTDNNYGIAGICWYCKIMTLKVNQSYSGEMYDSHIIKAIDYAVLKGAKIINLSLGGEFFNPLLEESIINAWQNNVLVIAAAGNNYEEVGNFYPAAHDHVISVGAINHNNIRDFYSNKGKRLDVVAYGSNILSTYIYTDPQSNYCINITSYYHNCLYGTSMSTPHVSGLAGLIYSHNNSLNNYKIRESILKTSQDLGDAGFDEKYGFGLINPTESLGYNGFTEDNTSPMVEITGLSNTYQKGMLKINGTVHDENLYIYKVQFKLKSTAEYDVNRIIKEFFDRKNVNNNELFNIESSQLPDGVYDIILKAEDYSGNTAITIAHNVTIDNTPPNDFSLIHPSMDTVYKDKVELKWTTTTDLLSSPVKYDVILNNNVISENLNTNIFNLNSSHLINEGEYSWKIRAKDLAGNIKESPTYKFKIDRTPPNNFSINVNIQDNNSIITFQTTDDISGVSYFELSLNNSQYITITSPHRIESLADGDYNIKIRAYDFVGNYRESDTKFKITYTCDNRRKKADLNCDSIVNLSDLSILAASWNKDSRGDTNSDGKTDIKDLSILAANWQKSI